MTHQMGKGSLDSKYGGLANTSGPFPTCPNCQIGDTDTIWSLVIGSQCTIEFSGPPIWQLGHRAFENEVLAKPR